MHMHAGGSARAGPPYNLESWPRRFVSSQMVALWGGGFVGVRRYWYQFSISNLAKTCPLRDSEDDIKLTKSI